VECYQFVVMLNNEHYKAFYNSGNAYSELQKYKEAIELYSKAIKLDANDATFFSNRCAAYLNLNNYGDALKDAEKCIKLKPDWSKGYYRKGCVLVEQKKYEEAASSLREALRYDADSADIKAKLDEVTSKLPKPKAPTPTPTPAAAKATPAPARGSPSQAAKPHCIKTHNDDGTPLSPSQLKKEEGNFHYKESRYEQAINFYSLAIEATTDENEKATLFSNRAAAYQQLQSYTEVIIDCGEALAIQPNNVKALLRRALAYENKEKFEQARKDFVLALSIDPSAKMASEALVRLDRAIRQQQNYKN
jgi:tetratricopeptide (TPR) repeat protein